MNEAPKFHGPGSGTADDKGNEGSTVLLFALEVGPVFNKLLS